MGGSKIPQRPLSVSDNTVRNVRTKAVLSKAPQSHTETQSVAADYREPSPEKE